MNSQMATINSFSDLKNELSKVYLCIILAFYFQWTYKLKSQILLLVVLFLYYIGTGIISFLLPFFKEFIYWVKIFNVQYKNKNYS